MRRLEAGGLTQRAGKFLIKILINCNLWENWLCGVWLRKAQPHITNRFTDNVSISEPAGENLAQLNWCSLLFRLCNCQRKHKNDFSKLQTFLPLNWEIIKIVSFRFSSRVCARVSFQWLSSACGTKQQNYWKSLSNHNECINEKIYGNCVL